MGEGSAANGEGMEVPHVDKYFKELCCKEKVINIARGKSEVKRDFKMGKITACLGKDSKEGKRNDPSCN